VRGSTNLHTNWYLENLYSKLYKFSLESSAAIEISDRSIW
jgi:hypothetical protein